MFLKRFLSSVSPTLVLLDSSIHHCQLLNRLGKQWADKRRGKQPREQQLREHELDVVENRVREATEPRRIRIREEGEPTGFFGEPARRDVFAEPARSEAPRIRLFDQDD